MRKYAYFIVLFINDIIFVYIERRIPIFHYRKGEGERWMPDAADDTTYEVHQDRCGILIFKVATHSKCMYLCVRVGVCA